MWVDSDDFVELDMVEKLVSAQRQNDADIVTCNTIVHLPKGKFSTKSSESTHITNSQDIILTALFLTADKPTFTGCLTILTCCILAG